MTPTGSSAPWSIGASTLESSIQQQGRVELFQGTDGRRARPIWVHVFDAGEDEGESDTGTEAEDGAESDTERASDPETVAAAADFVESARAFAEIDERALIRVNSTGTTPVGDPYVITDAADRGTLARRIGVGAGATDTDLSRVAGVIGRGLAAMHRRGLVHETLTPEKVLLVTGPTQERPGSGTLWDDEFVRLDIPGEVRAIQSPVDRFAAPEQLRGDSSSAATDIYRLSGVMAEMAAGRERRSGERWVDLLDEVSSNGRPALAGVLSRGLSAEAEHRPLSAEAWTDDVMPALGADGLGATGVGRAQSGSDGAKAVGGARSGWGPKLLKGAAALVVLGGLAVAATALLNRDDDVALDPGPEPTTAADLADEAGVSGAATDPAEAVETDGGTAADALVEGDGAAGTLGDGTDGDGAEGDGADGNESRGGSAAEGDDAADGDDVAEGDDADEGNTEGDAVAGSSGDEAGDVEGGSAAEDGSAGEDSSADGNAAGTDSDTDSPDADPAQGHAGATPNSNGSGSGSGSSGGSAASAQPPAAVSQPESVDKPQWDGPTYCPPSSGGPVSDLSIVQITDQTIAIEWSPVDEFLNVYVNERFHDTIIPGADLYVVEGLNPMSAYEMSVATGTDKYAGTMVCAQTTSFGSGGALAGVTMPTGFRVLQASASTITVSWDGDDASGYSLHLGSKKVATVGAGSTSFTFSGLATNRIYTLGIRALDSNNRSDILKIDGATTATPGGPVSGAPIEASAG